MTGPQTSACGQGEMGKPAREADGTYSLGLPYHTALGETKIGGHDVHQSLLKKKVDNV